ncbi:MAG: hypothetical protein LBT46_15235 [Planctomycetaceae bacterium]|jgi:predicted DNA-binding transcriptional regulator AlpA|nr:hypothetical protein [Planctomycetaceae bacterium]
MSKPKFPKIDLNETATEVKAVVREIKPAKNYEKMPFVDIGYIAMRIGKCTRTVKRMLDEGRFNKPVGKVGKTPVWNKHRIDTWIENGRHLKK